MKNIFTLIILFFLFQFSFSQSVSEKEIKGKITSDSISLSSVHVVNTSNYKTVISDQNGLFSIFAKEGDVLVFESLNFEGFRKIITSTDLISKFILINMIVKSIELKEVIINERSQITAENQVIIPYGQKKYTPAERRLKTAGDFKPIHLLGLLGGFLAVDPILNAISGRTKMLKKELQVERKEHLLAKIETLFEEDYYTKKLQIPSDHVRGFQYYCIEDSDFASALQTKNKTLAMFLIVTLAEQYNQIIKDEME